MKFRGDIEGLRGVAIVLVVLAHASVPGFVGGFVGVDVFFVISGYLITGQLLDELRARGRIDYWAFFARRLRRLAPALLLMLAATVAVASEVLPRFALNQQLAAAGWATAWLSNLYFIVADFGYFEPAAASNLFLHTWSLGVEEQFYLVWPLSVALAWKAGLRSWKPLAGFAVAAFALALLIGHWNPVAAYYSMPARLWQLATGALACVVARRAGGPLRGAAATGAGLLLAALCLIGEDSVYPGALALLPTLAAALLILGGEGAATLQWRPLRFLGRVSYGWYLWHWPVLSILPAMSYGAPTPTQTFALVLASLLLAWISCVFVEEPLRRTRIARPAAVVMVAGVALAALAAALLWHAGATRPWSPASRDARAFEDSITAQIRLLEVYKDPRCDQWYTSAEVVPCRVGRDHRGGVMVLLGDSVGAQWTPALAALADRHDLQLVVLTKSACLIADAPFVYPRIKRRYVECEQWRAGAIEAIRRMHPRVVVIGSSSEYPLTAQQWQQATTAVLRPLAAAADTVLVLAPTPILPFDAPVCVATRGWVGRDGRLTAPGCQAPRAEVERKDVAQALAAAADRVDGARLVNLNDVLCLNGICPALADGKLVFRDARHLNASYVESLSDAVAQRIEPLLASPRPARPAPAAAPAPASSTPPSTHPSD